MTTKMRVVDKSTHTKQRSIRVPDPRWDRFSEVAKRSGKSASAALNEYMQRVIDNESEQ